MQQLGNIVTAMRSPEVLPKEQPLGSMTTDGQTNTDLPMLRQAVAAFRERQRGVEAVNEALLATLKQLPSLSLTCRTRSVFDGDDFAGTSTDVTIVSGSRDELQPVLEALEWICRPARAEAIMREIIALWSVTAKRPEDAQDFQIKQVTMADELRRYPEIAVVEALRAARTGYKFFPTCQEITRDCDRISSLWSSLLRQLRAQKYQQAIAAKPHWKDKPRETWGGGDWQAWILDAEKMVEHYRKQEKLENMENWIAVVAERRNLAILAGVTLPA